MSSLLIAANKALISPGMDDMMIRKIVYSSRKLFVTPEKIEDFHCCVCTEIPYQAIELGCKKGHLMCKWCYDDYVKTNQQNHPTWKFRCPVDRGHFDLTDNCPNYTIQRIINGQKVKCMNYGMGCSHIFVLGTDERNMINHLSINENSCLCMTQTCNGCHKTFMANMIDKHINECSGRKVQCNAYTTILTYKEWANKHTRTSIKVMITDDGKGNVNLKCIPFLTCIQSDICFNHPACLVPVYYLDKNEDKWQYHHNRMICPYERVVCPLTPSFCQSFYRKDLELHFSQHNHAVELTSLTKNILQSQSEFIVPVRSISPIWRNMQTHAHRTRYVINHCLICLDNKGDPYVSTVKAIDHSSNKQRLFIHYEGWSTTYDEWITVPSKRIIPFVYGPGQIQQLVSIYTMSNPTVLAPCCHDTCSMKLTLDPDMSSTDVELSLNNNNATFIT